MGSSTATTRVTGRGNGRRDIRVMLELAISFAYVTGYEHNCRASKDGDDSGICTPEIQTIDDISMESAPSLLSPSLNPKLECIASRLFGVERTFVINLDRRADKVLADDHTASPPGSFWLCRILAPTRLPSTMHSIPIPLPPSPPPASARTTHSAAPPALPRRTSPRPRSGPP
jgi:hypothetical protein